LPKAEPAFFLPTGNLLETFIDILIVEWYTLSYTKLREDGMGKVVRYSCDGFRGMNEYDDGGYVEYEDYSRLYSVLDRAISFIADVDIDGTASRAYRDELLAELREVLEGRTV
jgi:hypothetical protein